VKCGTPLSARDGRRHHCDGLPGPGRPPVLRPCADCGAMLSTKDAPSHVCPPNPSQLSREELIDRISSWPDAYGRKRTFGTGSVFQARNQTWYGFITVNRDANGKRIRKKLTGHSRDEVERKLAEVSQAVVTAAAKPGPRPLSNRSLDQLRRMYSEILTLPASARPNQGGTL
jgi:hypothetical protein